MKKQITKNSLGYVMVLLFLVFTACERDEEVGNVENNKRVNEKTIHLLKGQDHKKIFQAQKWFSENTISTRASNASLLGWEYAFSDSTKQYETIEVPIAYKEQNCIVLPDCEEKYIETKDTKYLQNLTRLIIETDKISKKVRSYYMTIVPSAEYIEKSDNNISLNSYFDRESSFSGCILFSNLKGEFVNGWRYQDGEIIKEIKPQTDENKPQTRSGGVTWCQPTYTVEITEWYFPNTGRRSRTEEIIDVSWHCWREHSLTNSGHGGGGGGGGGPLLDPSPAPKVDDDLKKLFKGECSLSEEDIKKLNEEYEKMKEDCFYNTIDKYLKEAGIQFNDIKYDPSVGLASTSNTGNLGFSESCYIQAQYLKHEWIHLAQMQKHNLLNKDIKNIMGMMEWEVALVQDILFFIEKKGQIDNEAYTWAAVGSKKSKEKYKTEYIAWLRKTTNNGTRYPDNIDDISFMDFSKIFGETSREYSASFGYIYGARDYRPYALEELFKQANKNCK